MVSMAKIGYVVLVIIIASMTYKGGYSIGYEAGYSQGLENGKSIQKLEGYKHSVDVQIAREEWKERGFKIAQKMELENPQCDYMLLHGLVSW